MEGWEDYVSSDGWLVACVEARDALGSCDFYESLRDVLWATDHELLFDDFEGISDDIGEYFCGDWGEDVVEGVKGKPVAYGFVGVEEGEGVGEGDDHLAGEAFELASCDGGEVLFGSGAHDSGLDGFEGVED